MLFLPALQSRVCDMEQLMDTYSKPLMRLCYLYLKDYHLAEDAVQEALFKAYRAYGGFRGESSEKTWITRIAMNVCRDIMRGHLYRETADGRVELYPAADFAGNEWSGEDSLELLEAVLALPADYRQAVLLRYYQELSVEEISRILHQKSNTVSVRLKRARELLKSQLKEE